MSGSRIPGFYKLELQQRHETLRSRFGLSDDEICLLQGQGALDPGRADKMVENCVGVFGLPLGLGLNFLVNGEDMIVPMAVEEPSVVAAVSNMARLVRSGGGFQADADPPLMIGQIQLLDVPDEHDATEAILGAKRTILGEADRVHPNMAKRGGGARDVEVQCFHVPEPMLVVNLLVDCGEAMGANAINTMAEGIAPLLEQLSGGRAHLRILSNLADRRLARAHCRIPVSELSGPRYQGSALAQGIVDAYRFAAVDPYRATTHNKGVMNGVDAVAIATGNDWRSIEAAAHAYAARRGHYGSLTEWRFEDGYLHGFIELPMAVGVVGGSTQVHPTIRIAHKLMGFPSARQLAMVMAAVGLAQNLGALKALAGEGIQRGHMSLHARSVALAAGAEGELVQRVADQLVRDGNVKLDAAKALLDELRQQAKEATA